MRVTQGMVVNRFLRDLQNSERRLFNLQGKVSSGTRLQRPSDDPIDAARVMRFDSEDTEISRYLANAREARDWLGATESALNEAYEALTRAQEVALRANAGSLPNDALEALGTEVDVLVQHLLQVVNTAYKGRYLFSGTLTLNAPYEVVWKDVNDVNASDIVLTGEEIEDDQTGTVNVRVLEYQGNDGEIRHQIGMSVNVRANITGDAAFGDAFAVLAKLRNDLLEANVDNLDEYVAGIDEAIGNVVRLRSDIGGRMNRTELAAERLGVISLQIESLRSELADTDVARALVDLHAAELSLQTSMAMAARMFQTSLLDFLR